MNARDRSNLEFLTQLTPQNLEQWFVQASEDDVVYATELLMAWEQELDQQEAELGEEIYGVAFVQQSSAVH